METQLRAVLLDWLRGDPALADMLNAITEEAPVSASPPWLGIATSASAEWGGKTEAGREIRIAFELRLRGDRSDTGADPIMAIQRRIEAVPSAQDGMQIVTARFLRARVESRPRNLRSVLIEYRFRVLED